MSEIENTDEAVRALSDALLETARWRREQAVKSPNDTRNADAAELLEQLAGAVPQIHPALLQRWVEHWEAEEIGIRLSEFQSELLRQVGFSSAPASAEKLLEAIVDKGDELRADLDADRAADVAADAAA